MRPRLTPVAAAPHGGAAAAAIDLSASLNPLGPSPAALAAARAAELARYPEVDAGSLRLAAAARHGVDAAAVVPIPGASWGIWLCAVAFLGPGDRSLALAPCFSEYRRAAEIAGAQHHEVRAGSPSFLASDGAVAEALDPMPALCFVCNPGNPTGSLLPVPWLRRVVAAHPRTTFVVDEAFAAFAPPGASLLDDGPPPANVIVLRSLTKELGLPGLRMGYLVAAPELAAALRDVLPPWPLSAPALAAATAGMADLAHVAAGAELARRHLALLAEALRESGFEPFPSSANYLLARAPGLTDELARRGIAVRDCVSFGLPDHVRVAAPAREDLETVLAAFREIRVAIA